MKVIAGLGNPGAKYAWNRHNVGFMAVDRIAADHGFGPWRARFQGQASEGRLGAQKLLLIKPGTFMNRSGQALGEALRYYKLGPEDLIVIHDELDLAPGRIRVKTGGGHAGHNGLRSLHAHVGPDYTRIRLGIGHPGDRNRVSAWVLSDFPRAEREGLEALLEALSRGIGKLVAGDAPGFLNAVALARSSAPPGPAARPARPAPPGPDPAPDARSPIQKLLDRFR